MKIINVLGIHIGIVEANWDYTVNIVISHYDVNWSSFKERRLKEESPRML